MSNLETTKPVSPAPKKSVALSGVSPVTRRSAPSDDTGNDLHYRGYDILDLAESCEFEEIAHLLVHGTLPTPAELAAYKAKLDSAARASASRCAARLKLCRRRRIRWMSCAVASRRSAACCPSAATITTAGARDIADRLMASLGSMLLYWHHFAQRQPHRRRDRRRNDRRSFSASAARQGAGRGTGARHAHLAHSLRGA